MWPHKDLGWWGFVIAIVTLILAYPVDVLAHLTSPMLKNWWAERSVASLEKRIEKLDKQLADYEQNYPLLTPTEHHILRGIDVLGMVGALIVALIAIMILVACSVAPSILRSHDSWPLDFTGPLILLAYGALLFSLSVTAVVFRGIATFRMKRSPIDRDVLKKSIEDLKKRLAQRTMS
jgi:hypothetical protein